MELLFCLLAMFALTFAIKETDGPWGIMAWFRNKLVQNKYVGVFFYKLLSCSFCTGFWSGLIIYMMHQQSYKLGLGVVWGLTGAAISLILEAVLNKLST